MYYFAYGSNMNHEQLQQRCPGSRFIDTAYLNNARFRYDGHSKTWNNKAVANIISSDSEKVWGGLFEINENDMTQLDICEGFPERYGKKTMRVIDTKGEIHSAWVYFRIGEIRGEPLTEYRKVVLKGAENCNLPKEYIANRL
jgi:gamma-glutamylcyclotransferase (GGCT)/AIG2-like uncharacterized protein YtfP